VNLQGEKRLTAGGQAALALLAVLSASLAAARSDGAGGQGAPPVGFIARERVIEMAKAADPAFAAFEPSPAAVESFIALVDPVHLRMFFRPSQPADIVLAAKVGRAVEAASNQALTLELVAVTEDLSEPKALLAENAVTAAPEIVVYWLNAESGRLRPEPGSAVDADLADFIFQTRVQIAQEMLLDREFFKFTFHKDLLPLDCKRCHGPR
jgi:hypothetical protein